MQKKLLNFFKRIRSYFVSQPKIIENIYSIKIDMHPNFDVDVKLYYDKSAINLQNVIDVAEKYAELLVYINSSAFRSKLTDILEEKIKLSENVNEQLLLDNIISFQDIIRKEMQNASAANYTPVIRPISVFNLR